jgi:hypothetical protein
MSKKQIQPDNVPAPGGSYSHGIVVGDWAKRNCRYSSIGTTTATTWPPRWITS